MINLIPIEEKKEIKKIFYVRMFSVLFYVLGVCVLFFVVALLPSYFFASLKVKLILDKIEAQKREPVPEISQITMQAISELNNKLALIENNEKNKFLISEKVISEIISNKMSDIKIHKISFESDVNKGKNVKILGSAPNRERLLLFRRILESNKIFFNVDLPISNFVKGSNIEFFLNLQIK